MTPAPFRLGGVARAAYADVDLLLAPRRRIHNCWWWHELPRIPSSRKPFVAHALVRGTRACSVATHGDTLGFNAPCRRARVRTLTFIQWPLANLRTLDLHPPHAARVRLWRHVGLSESCRSALPSTVIPTSFTVAVELRADDVRRSCSRRGGRRRWSRTWRRSCRGSRAGLRSLYLVPAGALPVMM